MLAPVIQQETTGCGIACVAILANVSYEETKTTANRLGIFAEDEKLWSEVGYVRTLLREYGIDTAAEETPFSSWGSLPDLALLAIKHHWENERLFWHWVVFCRWDNRPMVLDPAAYLENNERTDFAAMQPKWFIEILC